MILCITKTVDFKSVWTKKTRDYGVLEKNVLNSADLKDCL